MAEGDFLGGVDDESDDDDIVEVESERVEESEDDTPSVGANSLVKPVENVEEVVGVYDQFEEIKEKLLDTNTDLTEIGGGVHVNKSGWRKIATAFNLSIETVSTDRKVEDGVVKFTVEAKAVAPNGKSVSGVAMCSSNESNHMESVENIDNWDKDDDDILKVDGKWRRLKEPREVNEHNIIATAETRAKNRAISDLVGGGEVSAEEIGSKKRKEILE